MAFERDEDGRRAVGCDGSTCAEDNRRAVELRILAIAHHGPRLFQLKSGLTSATPDLIFGADIKFNTQL